MELEAALDWLRTEGWGEPNWEPTPAPVKGVISGPGRFVNQCGRCLEYRQAHRVDLARYQRVWLCDACDSPNPPVVVFEKRKTWQQINKERKAALKAAQKEERRLERERKKGNDSVPRVRRSRAKDRKPEDAQRQGPEGPAVRLSGDDQALHGSDPVPNAH